MKEFIIKIWQKCFGKKTVQVTNIVEKEPVVSSAVETKQVQAAPLLQKLEKYLFKNYDFRFNVLTEQVEYACKGSEKYVLADQRTMNTFCIDARNQGINCWATPGTSSAVAAEPGARVCTSPRVTRRK